MRFLSSACGLLAPWNPERRTADPEVLLLREKLTGGELKLPAAVVENEMVLPPRSDHLREYGRRLPPNAAAPQLPPRRWLIRSIAQHFHMSACSFYENDFVPERATAGPWGSNMDVNELVYQIMIRAVNK